MGVGVGSEIALLKNTPLQKFCKILKTCYNRNMEEFEKYLKKLDEIILEKNREEKSGDIIAAIKLYAQIKGLIKQNKDFEDLEKEVINWLKNHS